MTSPEADERDTARGPTHALDYAEPLRHQIAFRRRLFIGVVVWIVFAISAAYWIFDRTPRRRIPPYIPPKAWLDQRLSYVDRNHKWHGAVEGKKGDEIWRFMSAPETWRQEWGTGGECLIRKGVIIDGRVTVVN